MIVEFSVKNFRSIKDLQTISFVATGLKSTEENASVDNYNIVGDGGMRLLKTVGIYGANASGKSNIIKALEYFLQAIKNEASQESQLKDLCDPFLYQENAESTESFFQIVLILDGKKYRYGFTTKRNINFLTSHPTQNVSKEIITNEWLHGTKEKNVAEYFTRKELNINTDTLPSNEKIPKLQYEHTLFLTHAAAFDNLGICGNIRTYLMGWTISNFKGIEVFRNFAVSAIDNHKLQYNLYKKNDFLQLLSSFNIKYDDIKVEFEDIIKYDFKIPQNKILVQKHHGNKNVTLNLEYNESAGTQKLFDIAGLLIRTFSFSKGAFIILDEIDSNFHPALLIKLIELFNDPSVNKNNSQLLFTSHDTNLLDPKLMRRDQFYFTEKNEDESTRLYSLADLRGIRNDADFARDYLRGIYGAVPVLNDFSIKSES